MNQQSSSGRVLKHQELVKKSEENIDLFWAEQAERITWIKKWNKVSEVSFKKPVSIKWYLDAKLNVCYNCVDRHLPHRAQQTAFIFVPDAPSRASTANSTNTENTENKASTANAPNTARSNHQIITYQDLYDNVVQMASVLKSNGVKKGDCVTIYMPMIPEAVYAMLACARIGAMHSVIFGGFAPDSILDRIVDCDSKFVITADEGVRGGKAIHLKNNVDQALHKIPNQVQKVLVIKHTGGSIKMESSRDIWYHEALNEEIHKFKDLKNIKCEPEVMDAEDPLFILYTSGSTNKPKGVLHTSGGYLVYASFTHQHVFNYQDGDVYWCTADVGWITGHSYIVYGPLANGATSIIYEGVPHYPDYSRLWQIVEQHKVNIFYTAPTAIRALMREGDAPVQKYSRKSLKLLGSVGEPINPEAWNWYHRVVGEGRCPVVDTWWQTETGGILISPLPEITTLKPGSATKPLYGIKPKMLTPEGQIIDGPGEGVLVLEGSWPGQMRTVYKDHARFESTYFATYPGYYFTGDGCKRDEDGYYWITGRVDDVLNVSGHRLGTAEIESALVAHQTVSEAAVVGFPHDIKGQAIYAFVTLKSGVQESPQLKKELIQWVADEISAIAKPEVIQWAPGLPKTRSGKIMRRILRKIAEKQFDNLGDITTLADPSVVQNLIQQRGSN